MNYEQQILKAQFSQEFHANSQIAGTDEHDFLKSMYDNLYSCYDKEGFEKSWSPDLAKRFPNGGWRTVNGSRVFINGGKVVAGLGGFNGMIDKFFEEKKSKSTEFSIKDKIESLDNKKKELLEKVNKLSKEHNKKYKDMDIESAMSDEEKKSKQQIADLHSEINQIVAEKKELGKQDKPKEEKETRQQFFELPDIKDIKDLDKNISKILSQYGNRDMASIQVEEYMKENLDIAKQWLKDKNIKSSDELKKYLKGRQGKDRKEIVGQKKESAKEWEKTKVESRVNDIVDLALQQEKQMQDKIKESDSKEIKGDDLYLNSKDKQLAKDYGFYDKNKKQLISEKNKNTSYIENNPKNHYVNEGLKEKNKLIDRLIEAHNEIDKVSNPKKDDPRKNKVWGQD